MEKALIENIRNTLLASAVKVEAAYGFLVKGTAGVNSDIEIAILAYGLMADEKNATVARYC